MHYPKKNIVPHYSQHIGKLSKEDCKWIKSLCTDFVSSDVRNNKTDIRFVNTYFRDSKTCFVKLNNNDREKLISLIGFLGVSSLPIDKEIQLLEYREGNFFRRHKDGVERYMTIIIQLSDEMDYQGGELFVDDQQVSKKQGTVVMFDANTFHQLDEVTSGKRNVLVIWLQPENLSVEKNII